MMNFDNSDPDTEVVEERLRSINGWQFCKEAGLTINPRTAEVTFYWRYVTDPYGVYSNLPDQLRQVGRVHFARSPDSVVWVSFHDIPDETTDELWRKVHAGAYPSALPGFLGIS